MDIKHLELSEEDFQLIIDGLEGLPEKGVGGEILGVLFEGLLSKDDPEAKAKLKQERDKRTYLLVKEKAAQKEEIRILQGKLLLLKRWLIAEGALKQANDILQRPFDSSNDR